MNWKHSGFSVHNEAQIAKDDEKGRVSLAQYIVSNTFSLGKITYHDETGTVIYRSQIANLNPQRGKNQKTRNWLIFKDFSVSNL